MSDHVYKSIELTGSSEVDITDAVRRAVAKASQTLRDVDWFELTNVRGHVADGAVGHFQVTVKVGFRLE